MISRRGFLMGAGGLLTASFVRDARSFVLRKQEPLLVPPPQADWTIFWHDNGEQGVMLTVGEWDFCPPAPTWREFFVSEGIPHRAASDAEHLFAQHGIEPADYDDQVDGFWWETRFDLETGPTAKAFKLLRNLDLGPDLAHAARQPHLVFCEGDVANADSRWVDVRDHLTLSLLQARLIDLDLPIKIEAGR